MVHEIGQQWQTHYPRQPLNAHMSPAAKGWKFSQEPGELNAERCPFSSAETHPMHKENGPVSVLAGLLKYKSLPG